MARPSCRKKNSRNSIRKKPTSVPKTAERKVAAHGGRGLSSDCRPSLTQPSTCVGAHRGVVARPGDRPPISGSRQPVEQIGVGRQAAAAQVADEVRHLAGEYDAQHRERRQHQKGRQRGEDPGGERAPALRAPREPLVQRMQDERQHRRPADLLAQRHEDPVERVARIAAVVSWKCGGRTRIACVSVLSGLSPAVAQLAQPDEHGARIGPLGQVGKRCPQPRDDLPGSAGGRKR